MKAWFKSLIKRGPWVPALALLGLLLLGAGFGLILWKVPQWQTPQLQTPSGLTDHQARANFENEARRTIAQILLGSVVLVGVYFTWRRVQAADRTVQVSQEQQITERFTRAIDQLGNRESRAIRLGGIYALERIARDSPDKDHWQIMEVLTAYVRENARWVAPPEASGPTEEGRQAEQRVETDIQAILTVLGRRNREYETPGQRLDLRGTDLRGANLSKAHLEGVNLSFTHLRGANLTGAYLEEALLIMADLPGAHLGDANLARALLTLADLERADLRNANLEGADLGGANLKGANLSRANLEGVNLILADLEGADLILTNLEGADLGGANLKGAHLGDANLKGAHLSRTNQDDANFYLAGLERVGLVADKLELANLSLADLRRAGLSAVNLEGAWTTLLIVAHLEDARGLTQEQVDSALISESTVLPDYLRTGRPEGTG